jgi:beta-lactam-binding protein with PASTA domain
VLSLLWPSLAFRMVWTVYRVLAMAPGVRTITQVPKLIGPGSHMAEPLIRKARLSLGVIRLVATSEVTAGVVMDQHPRPGRPVASGTPVDLTVASGELR